MHRTHPRRSRRSGFTLIEIMAVVLIIGLLTGVVGYQIFQQVDKGRVEAAKAQIKSLEGALELYRMDNGSFPSTEQGLAALVQEPVGEPAARNYPAGGYLRGGAVPGDPWGEPYQYLSPGENNSHSFDIWSNGADRAPGGDGINQDIGNWSETTASL